MQNVIKMVGLVEKFGKSIRRDKFRWSARQQADFFQLLGQLLETGFSLQEALLASKEMLPRQAEDIILIIDDVSQGQILSRSLKAYVGTVIFCQLQIAEQHGRLEESVIQIGKLLGRNVEQKAKLQGLLLYPIILGILLVIILAVIHLWVKPALQQIGPQQMLFSQRFHQLISGIALLIVMLILAYFVKIYLWWKKQPKLDRHLWYSQLPLVGKVYCQYSYYYLAFNLALMLKSGMDFRQICNLLLRFDQHSLLYQLGQQFESWLNNGQELAGFVQKYPFIPPEFALFFQEGLTQENLSGQLMIFAELSYQRLLKRVDRILNLIQPLLFVVIAVIIVLTYASILIPMYHNLGGLQ
ncbi:type II secretion system F family protein [Ligilactobacillus equi]